MDAITEIWKNLDWSVPVEILLRVLPALLCITLHELSHGYTAWRLGDTTARDAGRLTLNPVKHIDPMGLLMMVVFRFGWARPVPVNMFRFRHPRRGMAVTALAGPVSNLLICLTALFLYGLTFRPLMVDGVLGAAGRYISQFFYLTAYISLGMGIFNLLPVPPLDGSKVLYSVLSDEAYLKLMRYERYGMLLLLVLVWSGVLGSPLSQAVSWTFDKVFAAAEFGYKLTSGGLN
ncbi:MAG: site-2 protease family protein [Oscillospiraceae bacterium]|nr:site-2 protease family protein [Oscillospiraceae bacterium]